MPAYNSSFFLVLHSWLENLNSNSVKLFSQIDCASNCTSSYWLAKFHIPIKKQKMQESLNNGCTRNAEPRHKSDLGNKNDSVNDKIITADNILL